MSDQEYIARLKAKLADAEHLVELLRKGRAETQLQRDAAEQRLTKISSLVYGWRIKGDLFERIRDIVDAAEQERKDRESAARRVSEGSPD